MAETPRSNCGQGSVVLSLVLGWEPWGVALKMGFPVRLGFFILLL